MASIQMNMGTETEINATPNKDGLILFDTTNKKIILDNNGTREVLTKHIEANPNLNGAEQLENLKVNGEVLNFLPVDISNVEKDGEEISDILEDKYNTEGDYNTTVDKCTDLTRVTPVTDTAPYIYRQTPVKESFKALMKKIVGASVVWNQILPNGNFADTSLWGKVFASLSVANNIGTIEATDSGKEARIEKNWTGVSGHKYLCTATVKNDGVLNSSVVFYYNGTSSNVTQYYTSANWITVSRVISQTTDSASNLFRLRVVNSSSVGDTSYAKNCMIADLTAMFGTTIADYVYTLETSQSGSGIAWLQSYGFFTEDYYAYKQNKLESGCVSAHKTYDGETLLTNTELSPITLRGLLGLSDGKLTVNGDEYNADGSVTRKYGVVDLGTLGWNLHTSGTFYASLGTKKRGSLNLICDLYTSLNVSFSFNNYDSYPDKVIGSNTDSASGIYVFVKNTAYTDTQTFTNAMRGVYLIYELAEPTTEQTTPFTETEIVGSTEEFIDYEVAQSNRDVAIPVGTETEYYVSYNIPSMPFTDCYLSASNQKLGWVSNS